jgi:hypothetical protein
MEKKLHYKHCYNKLAIENLQFEDELIPEEFIQNENNKPNYIPNDYNYDNDKKFNDLGYSNKHNSFKDDDIRIN